MEMDPIRQDAFCCPILFSIWRVRRSWLSYVVKKCSNIEVQREIFKRLGEIVYSIWDCLNTSVALEDLVLDFVDQSAFIEYFKSTWVPKIEMWLSTIKTFPLASQEASGAVEAYHVQQKTKFFHDSHLGALQRVNWLVHKLATELQSGYWHFAFCECAWSMQGNFCKHVIKFIFIPQTQSTSSHQWQNW